LLEENQTALNKESYCNASPFSNCNKDVITKSKEMNDATNVE